MRAAALEAPGRLRVGRFPAPEPGDDEILVRVEGCGVCGSNVPVWEGRPWFSYPLAPGQPGHEGWGTVAELGRGVDGPPPGTRVAFLSERAFAELDVARADAVVPLPPELDGLPFPGEAVGCAVNVLRRSGVERGSSVAVVGVGFLGALLVALARDAGARVTALGRRPFALHLAREMGAERALALTDAPAEDFDCVIEAAGAQETLDVAARLTRIRGRLVIAGYHQDELRTVDMQLWNWRGLDVVNAHERDPHVYVEGMRGAIDAVASGRVELRPLLTHSFPLERAGEALDAARTRPDGFLKALVTL
ncbi:MAG: zinc-binding dehydrogenase [Actinobacteria bacterium]|nr:zinc-binding dehydrogenase [Actinomycetota bacterium]